MTDPPTNRVIGLVRVSLIALVGLVFRVDISNAERYWFAPAEDQLRYVESGERITPFACPPFGRCELQFQGVLGLQIDGNAKTARIFDVDVELSGQRPESVDNEWFREMMEERFELKSVESETRAVFEFFFNCGGPFGDTNQLETQIDGNQLTLSGGYDDRACDGDAAIIQAVGLGADTNSDGLFDAADIDTPADLNRDDLIDFEDRRILVEVLGGIYFGDANVDGRFNSSDLVKVFEAGEYEDSVAENSTWSEGDWNGDRDFDSSDLVTAFKRSGAVYECTDCDRPMVVPEPSSLLLMISATLAIVLQSRSRR